MDRSFSGTELSTSRWGGERWGERDERCGHVSLSISKGMETLHHSPASLRQRLCSTMAGGTDSRTQISEAVPEAWLNLHRRWADLGKTRKGTKYVSNGQRFSGSAALPGTQFRDFTCLSLCALKREREKGSERESKENQRSKCVAPRDKPLKVESQVKL